MPSPDLAKLIGERIRILRKFNKMSQEELAQVANLHPTYVGQLERGEKNATIETLGKVASALNIAVGDLFKFGNSNVSDDNKIQELINLLHTISSEDQVVLVKVIDVLLEWKKVGSSNKQSV